MKKARTTRKRKATLHAMLAAWGLAAATAANAWVVTPTDVSFVNQDGLAIPGKLFKPAGAGPFPAVVMMHGCSGAYSFSDPAKGVASLYREWGDRLVMQGYVALLVDSFTPRNTQNQCGNGANGVSEINARPFDAYAALGHLSSLPYVNAGRVGLLGWSHGASATLASIDATRNLNGTRPFKAAVAFYPGCGMYNAFGGIGSSTWQPYSPTSILHGTADSLYADGYCATRVQRAQQFGATATLTAYNDAKHSFDMAKDATNGFTGADVSAKTTADPLALNLFNANLK